MLEQLKKEICMRNIQLAEAGLVAWTSGNVSGRDPKTGLIAIKPSGVPYSELKPADIVIVNLSGKVIDGRKKPSVDTPTHLFVYMHRPDVKAITHTHSNYATAFAAAGKPLKVYLTAIADEFGGPVPVSAYAKIGGTDIGREIVKKIGKSPAILMKQHGVFTVGPTPESAVKAAVMIEDVCKTCFIAMMIGKPKPIPSSEVARGHKRYIEQYGQGRGK
jgi:L-ribulose-5-phosphate 4-epimerase